MNDVKLEVLGIFHSTTMEIKRSGTRSSHTKQYCASASKEVVTSLGRANTLPILTQSRGWQWTTMTKTQNTNSNSQPQRNTYTTSTTQARPSSGSSSKNSLRPKRNQNRRWQNKRGGTQKRTATPSVPSKQYISACCNAPGKKPPCGTKVVQQDPETRKMKDTRLGKGKWRCTACGKRCKVSVHTVKQAEATVASA